MATKYFNVVIVCNLPGGGNQFLKYHNIKPDRLLKFCRFCRQIPDLHHVNFYDKETKRFVKQLRAEEIEQGIARLC